MPISLRSSLGLCFLPISALAQDPIVPVLNTLIPDRVEAQPISPITIELANYFGTEPILDELVRLEGNYQDNDGNLVTANLDFLLFSQRSPITRDNFLGYVERGDYLTSVIHRSAPGFVIQGGGFTILENGENLSSVDVPTQPPILNEFGVSNTARTISMAKRSSDPDSATSQWFVSLAANSNNLDFQNGGFTVFGRISQSTFANAQLLDPTTPNAPDPPFLLANLGGAFTSTPLHQSAFGDPLPPLTLGDFFRIVSTSRVPVPASEAGTSTALNYTVTNQAPDFSESITGSTLRIEPLSLSPTRGAQVDYDVTATDSVGNEVIDTFTLSVTLDYETWRNQVFTPEQQNDDLVSGPMADPNNDGRTNLQAYAQDLDPFENISSDFIAIDSTPNNQQILLSFRSNINTTSVDFFVEESDDLVTWTRSSSTTIAEIPEPLGRQVSIETFITTAEGEVVLIPRRFYRLAFTFTP